MKVNFKIHTISHIIKAIIGTLEFSLSKPLKNKSNFLYVVNFHGTEQKFIENFKKQIAFLNSNFTIIKPNELDLFYSKKLTNKQKPFLLLTFDDGIKNNILAANILNNQKLSAFFFIIPQFVNTPILEQEKYFKENIRNKINEEIFTKQEDFMAMSWADIIQIRKDGHKIGSHTLTHKLIANKSDLENSKEEIATSKFMISTNTEISPDEIDSFCSINNSLESIGEKELKLIKENYKYHFTTLPGPNHNTDNKLFIKRCNIESFWLMGSVKYALGNLDLIRWKNKIATFGKLF